MNTYITQTIRAGIVLGVALFAFAGEVFAAPTLAPVQANQITTTSVTLVGYVENSYKTSTVWFEWGESSSLATLSTVGLTRVYHGGFFKAYLSSLKPDTTYYYRAVAMEEGVTPVTSTIASFRTTGVVGATVAVVNQNTSSATSNSVPPTSSTVAPVTTKTTSVSSSSVQAKKSTTPVTVAKKVTPVVAETATTKEGFDRNANTATVIGAGGVFPGTLIGWVALFIALLVAILLFLMIYESSEKRKKAHLAKKLAEEEKEKEVKSL